MMAWVYILVVLVAIGMCICGSLMQSQPLTVVSGAFVIVLLVGWLLWDIWSFR